MADARTSPTTWYSMAELARSHAIGAGLYRQLRGTPAGAGGPVVGEGYWLVLQASNIVASFADIILDEDHVDHVLLDDHVLFQFSLEGATRLDVAGDGPVDQDGFRCTVIAARAGRLVRQFIAGSRVRRIGLAVPLSVLVADYGLRPESLRTDLREALFGEGEARGRIVGYRLTRDQLAAIHALLECDMSGTLRARFIEAKLSELLCLSIEQLATPQAIPAAERERLAVEMAAELIGGEAAGHGSIDTISRQVGLGRNKMIAAFRKRYGMSPGEYAREAKLTHARGLIADDALSMLDIAEAAGFTSQTSFSRAYRARFGRSPSDERRAQPARNKATAASRSNR